MNAYPISRQVTRAEERRLVKGWTKPCAPGGRSFKRKIKQRGPKGFPLSRIKNPGKFLNSSRTALLKATGGDQ